EEIHQKKYLDFEGQKGTYITDLEFENLSEMK
ncbi:unnamed protein product, partial [marine sediment metagenome]